MTAIPLFVRSSQSRILFGFPVRTTKTIVEEKGVLFLGSRACHILGRRPALDAIASMSPESASVTTSASRPSMTDRACLPEPPCDWLIVTFWPVLAAPSCARPRRRGRGHGGVEVGERSARGIVREGEKGDGRGGREEGRRRGRRDFCEEEEKGDGGRRADGGTAAQAAMRAVSPEESIDARHALLPSKKILYYLPHGFSQVLLIGRQ